MILGGGERRRRALLPKLEVVVDDMESEVYLNID